MPSFTSAFHAISERAKQHNASVQGAYEAFYGVPSASSSSKAQSARPSVSSATPSTERRPSTWGKVKQAAKEQNRAANDAYLTFYGYPARKN